MTAIFDLAIKVIVDERTARIPANRIGLQSGRVGDVVESSVAFVVIKNAVAVVGDEQIFVAIVVIVADASTLSPANLSQSSFLGDVGEMHVPEITVKMNQPSSFVSLPFAIHSGRIHQQNVHQSVVIQIEDGDAVARRFENVALVVRIAGNIFRGQPSLGSNVPEIDGDLKRKGLGLGA